MNDDSRMFEWKAEDGPTFMVDRDWQPTNVSACRGCRQLVLWVITKAGKKMPVNHDGTSHFSTCPRASSFRAPKEPDYVKDAFDA